jgi:hypothetical protein
MYAPGKVHSLFDFMSEAKPWDTTNVPSVFLGHFPFGAQSEVSPQPFVTTCFRDPVLRVISRYEYVHRTEVIKQSLDAFVAGDVESHNGMVRRLCGYQRLGGKYWDFANSTELHRDEFDIDEGDLARAKLNVDKMIDFIMVQERMTESLVGLRQKLKSRPLLSISNQARNSRSKPIRLNDYPTDVVAKIEQANQLDRQLYDFACEKFEEQIADIGLRKHEVVAMDDICAALMIPGRDDLPADLVNQRMIDRINELMAANEELRAEAMVDLLCERLPGADALKNIHQKILQHCHSRGLLPRGTG